MKYPEKVERRPDPDVRYPDEVDRRPDSDVRYPNEVERRSNIIAAVRYPGGLSENFHPGGMSDATGRKGDVCVSKGEEATWHFLGRIPQQSYLNFFKGNIS